MDIALPRTRLCCSLTAQPRAGFNTASIEFKDERIELVVGNQEYGTGLVTSYKQLVSDQLGVDPDRVDLIMGHTDRTPSGLTGGSRARAVAGVARWDAPSSAGTQLAAHLLEVSAQNVRFAHGLPQGDRAP